MTKGVKPYHNRTNKAFLGLFLKKKLTIEAMAKSLNVSIVTAMKYLDNPLTMRLNQLLLLSGYLDIPFIELVYLLHYNKAKVLKEDKEVLSGLVGKYSKE